MHVYSDSATEEDVFSQMEEPGESRLARHIQDLMFGPKGRRKFPKHDYKPTGCIDYEILGDAVSSAHKPPPWLTDQTKPAGGPSEK